MYIRTQVCVLGAGAGGTGCVYRLLRRGISTVVVDQNPDFGGTMVYSGVDGFEPGVSLPGLHETLRDILQAMPQACHVLQDVPNCNLLHPENGMNWENHSFRTYPWGLAVHSDLPYEDTLHRKNGQRFQFEPAAMTKAIRQAIAPYGERLTEFFGWTFLACEREGRKLRTVTLQKGSETVTVEADWFVDASGNIELARAAGCAHTLGTECKADFSEPSAPEEASHTVNAVSFVFRIAPHEDTAHIDPPPIEHDLPWEETKMRRVVSCFSFYPNGDINVNMLPTMQGQEYLQLGDRATAVGHARVRAYWHWLQKEKGLQGYTLTHIYDAGVRETWRLRGRHVLTEQELRAGGVPGLTTAAIADHALDIHGQSGMCKELEKPYAIPLDCTLPRELDNLSVACRGASFTHIAAASARLNRTVLSLGEQVGEYIADRLMG